MTGRTAGPRRAGRPHEVVGEVEHRRRRRPVAPASSASAARPCSARRCSSSSRASSDSRILSWKNVQVAAPGPPNQTSRRRRASATIASATSPENPADRDRDRDVERLAEHGADAEQIERLGVRSSSRRTRNAADRRAVWASGSRGIHGPSLGPGDDRRRLDQAAHHGGRHEGVAVREPDDGVDGHGGTAPAIDSASSATDRSAAGPPRLARPRDRSEAGARPHLLGPERGDDAEETGVGGALAEQLREQPHRQRHPPIGSRRARSAPAARGGDRGEQPAQPAEAAHLAELLRPAVRPPGPRRAPRRAPEAPGRPPVRRRPPVGEALAPGRVFGTSCTTRRRHRAAG